MKEIRSADLVRAAEEDAPDPFGLERWAKKNNFQCPYCRESLERLSDLYLKYHYTKTCVRARRKATITDIATRVLGILVIAISGGLLYLGYYLLSAIFKLADWISGLTGAPSIALKAIAVLILLGYIIGWLLICGVVLLAGGAMAVFGKEWWD